MKMFDILLNISGELEWICGGMVDNLDRAITDAIQLVGEGEYVGHKAFVVVNGAWEEVSQ